MEAVIESSNGMSAGQDNLSSSTLTPSVSSERAQPVANERSFTQSELNDHIGRAKRDAVESYKRQQTQQPQQQQYAKNDYGPDMSHLAAQTYQDRSAEDHIRRIAAEEAQRARENFDAQNQQRNEEQQAQALVQKFFGRISNGKEKYQDFDTVTGGLDLRPFPWSVQIMTENVDNTTDVLYELSKDPRKLAQIEWLAERSPALAVKEAQRLSQSIKDNEAAKNIKLPNEPLNQLRQTNVGLSNGTARTPSDYRAMFKKQRA